MSSTKPQWKLVITTVVVTIFLIVVIVIGSILVNVEWPTSLGAWLKALFGGLLILTSAIGTTYVAPAVKAVIKDRGGANRDHRAEYLGLEQLSRITPQRTAMSIALTGVLIAGAILLPRISLPETPPLEPGPVRLLAAIDESAPDARRTLLDQWNSAHPENRVDLISAAGETDEQHARFVNDARATHEADVFLLDNVWIQEFIEREYILPIDESELDEHEGDPFLTNLWETCRDADGDRPGVWAVPFTADAGLMYYRSGTALPRSWDDYLGESARSALDEANAGRPAPGFEAAAAAQLAQEEVLTINALEAIWAADGIVVETGNVTLNGEGTEVMFDDSTKTALRKLAAAFEDQEIVVPGSETADEAGSRTLFRDGKAMYTRDWPVAHDNFIADEFLFEVANLPYPSVLGGQNLAIARTTDKPRAAQELIEFLTSPSSQLTLFELGGFAPTRQSAYDNSRREYANLLADAVKDARLRPRLANYTKFSRAFREGVNRALKDEGRLEPEFARRLADIVREG